MTYMASDAADKAAGKQTMDRESDAAAAPADRSAAAPGCIFCAKPREDADTQNWILRRGQTCFTILNAFPYNSGHLMVVPFRHLSHPAELTADESAELMQTATALTRALDTVYRPDGYNLGMNVGSAAGAGIAGHLHLHVVPRWGGDTNYMTVVGQTRVLTEMLESAYARLKAALGE